ncbi:MAG: alanine racemase [Candidatus Berkelbacteria bacterium]|nr:alanine racemase [Candidatus Berkelbacteria bacterium]
MAVVKSNAYGHGIVECSKAAVGSGADWLGVVNIGEAITLRKNNIECPILVMGFVAFENLKLAADNYISIPVIDLEYAKNLAKIDLNKPLNVHLKIETGLNRLGMSLQEAVKALKILRSNHKINIEGIYSHLAAAEEDYKDFTNKQITKLQEAIATLEKEGINFKYRHIAASAASLVFPEESFSLVRFGIAIYGLWASPETRKAMEKTIKLEPVLSYRTKIVQIKKVEEGEKIGYGCTFSAEKNMTIAILPVGYYEGIDRRFSSSELGGDVLISGKRCPFVGRICMNMAMVDITTISDGVKAGDEVALIGKQGSEEITADDWAKKLGTINYEIVSRIPSEIPRIYKR